jgi:hypothetical protein
MISKSMISKYGSLNSLRRLVNTDFPERAEIAERIARREGTLTTRVRGSHVGITVRLRRRWTMLLDWTPTGEQLRTMAAWLECLGTVANNALVLAVIGTGLYVCGEVIWAFMPGGAAWRFLEGVR